MQRTIMNTIALLTLVLGSAAFAEQTIDWRTIDTGGGELIFSEIMQNPSAVSDSAGEWFELHNPTGSAININGPQLVP